MRSERGIHQGAPTTSEIARLLQGEDVEQIPQEELATLIPEAVRRVAKNPDQLEIRQLHQGSGIFSFVIIEKNFPEELTSPKAYADWKERIRKAQEELRAIPKRPPNVNKLHGQFDRLIDKGELSLSDRILMTCKFKLHPDNPQALYVAEYDGEEHKGIGQDFYKKTLPDFAKKMGLRFIVGQNRKYNVSFFIQTLGRYAIHDLKPEYQDTLFPGASFDSFFTIQFLYPEDVEKYVRKDEHDRGSD